MNGRKTLLLFLTIALFSSLTVGLMFANEQRVFPGAEGFGTTTLAGRGGKVIKVTNLNADGPGSFKAAVSASGPRIVVFEVGGIIDLQGRQIPIRNPYLTIAGQTAPYPGITFIKGGISVTAHDVLIKHIKIRPGDNNQPKAKGWEPDGLTTYGADAYNIVIDHVSATWAVDENLSCSGPRHDGPEATSRNITISNCLIAEALSNSTHTKGEHSKGSLLHDYCRNISIVKNIYAHNVDRNPYFKAYANGVVLNNFIYNPGKTAIRLDYVEKEWAGTGITPQPSNITVIGNLMYQGVDTIPVNSMISGRGGVFAEDNLAYNLRNLKSPLKGQFVYFDNRVTKLQEKPVWDDSLTVLPASKVYEYTLLHAGAFPKQRDSVDARIIEDIRNGKGKILNSQSEVGGYPQYQEVRRPLEVPTNDVEVEAWLEFYARQIE